ncbi:MAG: hypothetical protein L0Z53_02255 [Acidobacteriales bacterium]|nr:hypothetical protein [Terriglobales bacterium]
MATEQKPRSRFQFGLGRLMIVVLAVAVCLALVRYLGVAGLFVFAVGAGAIGQPSEKAAYLFVLKSLTAYCIVSTLTLPFLDSLWLGELPVLALIQQPKVALADWLRSEVVMELIARLGFSSGSFSPDYIAARPYGLAMAFLIPLGILLPTIWLRTRTVSLGWTCVLLIVSAVDFCVTLIFAGGPGLSVY